MSSSLCSTLDVGEIRRLLAVHIETGVRILAQTLQIDFHFTMLRLSSSLANVAVIGTMCTGAPSEQTAEMQGTLISKSGSCYLGR